jgi:hypothetical protein
VTKAALGAAREATRLADDDDAESGSAIVNLAAYADRGVPTVEIRRRRPGDADRQVPTFRADVPDGSIVSL